VNLFQFELCVPYEPSGHSAIGTSNWSKLDRRQQDITCLHVQISNQIQTGRHMRTLTAIFLCIQLTACGTLLAVADGVGTVAVYGVKTVINTVDAITPDIVNKDD